MPFTSTEVAEPCLPPCRCDGSFDCRVWIGADFWATPAAIVHELGHNLYLAHAGAMTPAGVYDECEPGQGCLVAEMGNLDGDV